MYRSASIQCTPTSEMGPPPAIERSLIQVRAWWLNENENSARANGRFPPWTQRYAECGIAPRHRELSVGPGARAPLLCNFVRARSPASAAGPRAIRNLQSQIEPWISVLLFNRYVYG